MRMVAQKILNFKHSILGVHQFRIIILNIERSKWNFKIEINFFLNQIYGIWLRMAANILNEVHLSKLLIKNGINGYWTIGDVG